MIAFGSSKSSSMIILICMELLCLVLNVAIWKMINTAAPYVGDSNKSVSAI